MNSSECDRHRRQSTEGPPSAAVIAGKVNGATTTTGSAWRKQSRSARRALGSHLVGSDTNIAFRGRGYEHVVDLPNGARMSGVLSETRAERHSSIGLRLDPAGCLFFSSKGLSNGTQPDRHGG